MIDKTPKKIQYMFNNIAQNYDLCNNIISFFTHTIVKKYAISKLGKIPNNSKILDLCCGTGDLGRIIKQLNQNTNITGIDFSKNMLDIAKEKNRDILYKEEDATNLSFENNSFNYVVEGFGLRNIENRAAAISEAYRVLKDNGKYLHIDFGNNSIFNSIYNNLVPILILPFVKDNSPYKYLINSKKEFPKQKELINEFSNQGFKLIYNNHLLFGIISILIFEK